MCVSVSRLLHLQFPAPSISFKSRKRAPVTCYHRSGAHVRPDRLHRREESKLSQEPQSVGHDGDSGTSGFGYCNGILAFEDHEIDARSIEGMGCHESNRTTANNNGAESM